ncbi:MAG: Fur family transcriptional regulator [Candidatus Nanopelagicales bacterium]|nr:Fur family transcriptional regulator [Candidatus Nanopelagicales bacterium]
MTGEPVASSAGSRTTRQRLAVAEALAESDEFKSAQQWHDVIRSRGHSVGLTTVYRTLQALVDTGDVDVIVTEEGESKFRRCSTGHHHHLVCRCCGSTVEISAEEVERWTQSVAAEHGFTAERHVLEVTGVCPNCASAESESTSSEIETGSTA